MSLALLAAASGCSHEQRDWHSAQAANTIEAYEEFISTHPKSARTADAQTQIAQLTEARDWQRASTIDTADAYRQFLVQHPQGKSAQEAHIRIENFGLGATAAGAVPGTAAPAANRTCAGTLRSAASCATTGSPDGRARRRRPLQRATRCVFNAGQGSKPVGAVERALWIPASRYRTGHRAGQKCQGAAHLSSQGEIPY
jgi:hypothetical protein